MMNEESLFHEALEIPSPEERAAFLAKACAHNPELKAAVEALLEAHESDDGLLADVSDSDESLEIASDRFAFETTRKSDLGIHSSLFRRRSVHRQLDRVGKVISGRYTLLEEIGEGGMGTVWAAEQTHPVRRKVALKLIKPGMDSRSILARFEAERQALAILDHVNIAKVMDAGQTEDGRPYFVMEYVKGLPITRYCDEARLGISERLTLFIAVCGAVQHAHQKGIIHRDIKPSNILACLSDGVAVVKVIDFGLAKSTQQPLTADTVFTIQGMVMGTPLYMSPEQAGLNGSDIDTRTDIYALGVVLYELLTGTTPFQQQCFKEAAWHEIMRLIKEEEPPRPSIRLSDTETLPSVAAQRRLEPVRLTKLIRGELDWIVMKCLEKDRSRRYDTANDLARDVQRFLSDEVVEARPPSTGYRFRKLLQRNRVAAVATGLVILALVSGIVGTTMGFERAKHERQLAVVAANDEHLARLRADHSQDAAESARVIALTETYQARLSEIKSLRAGRQPGWRMKRSRISLDSP